MYTLRKTHIKGPYIVHLVKIYSEEPTLYSKLQQHLDMLGLNNVIKQTKKIISLRSLILRKFLESIQLYIFHTTKIAYQFIK